MSHRGFARDGTGIHTVEGTVAGARAARLTKQREKDQEDFVERKRRIVEEQERRGQGIDAKFSLSSANAEEKSFRAKTYGLVTAEEFRRAREEVEGAPSLASQGPGPEQSGSAQAPAPTPAKADPQAKKRRERKRKRKQALLSFGGEEEDIGAATPAATAASLPPTSDAETNGTPAEPAEASGEAEDAADAAVSRLKNPNVDTTFLPDRARDAALEKERQRLRQEWDAQQSRIRAERLEVTYSYWDGSGHRRSIHISKGSTIGEFLARVRAQLVVEFPELRTTASENLVYVKEDLIVPHHFSFYDLIVTKARGKSGPLFHFDVHDDVRLTNDATVEKDESHPGKVVERSWYDRNKHIFPASRWEIYDPKVQRGAYTIHGAEVNSDPTAKRRT